MNKEDKVSYYKRIRGLLKKSIEMSTNCGQDVFVAIRDPITGKLVEFNSTEDFDIHAVIEAKYT